MEGGIRAIERVDRFLGGVLETLPANTLLVISSDHGNLEDVTGGHTRNPAFTLMHGPQAHQLREGIHAIDQIPQLLLSVLSDGTG